MPKGASDEQGYKYRPELLVDFHYLSGSTLLQPGEPTLHSYFNMFFNRMTSLLFFVLGLFICVAQASPVLSTRADNSTVVLSKYLSLLKTFDSKVQVILPELTRVDASGKDATPVLERLYKEYDWVITQLDTLPDDTSEKLLPIHREIEDLVNRTQLSVNKAATSLRTTACCGGLIKWIGKLFTKLRIKFKFLGFEFELELEWKRKLLKFLQ